MLSLNCRIKDYIQPFERELAMQELRALVRGNIIPVDGDESTATNFSVLGSANATTLRGSLAYWHSVNDGKDGLTTQLRAEATSLVARNGVSISDIPGSVRKLIPSKLPNKRCLRYATHGLHEYRGKFFPQLVRALINIARVPDRGVVLDPMCGSGTTLVETILAGKLAYGLDINPLSVFVAEVKCQALSLDASAIVSAYETLRRKLEKPPIARITKGYYASLQPHDQDYLAKWFASETLIELDEVHGAIQLMPTDVLRDFYLVCLSNILRSVSWQKEDDLRIRKEIRSLEAGEVISRFLDEALRSSKMVAAFLAERGSKKVGRHVVQEADARLTDCGLPNLAGKVDAVITSPPYATALPYLDTDRLSLIYLGLLPRQDHRLRDTLMIGNREVTERSRAAYWATYEANRSMLPQRTCDLIDKVDKLNRLGSVGFRRRNLAALLSKYFFDMREVIRNSHELLKPDGTMFLVVGNNRTTAGDQPVEISTADHLSDLAESEGFTVSANISMEMLVSRDIFRKNTMASEQILMLSRQ